MKYNVEGKLKKKIKKMIKKNVNQIGYKNQMK